MQCRFTVNFGHSVYLDTYTQGEGGDSEVYISIQSSMRNIYRDTVLENEILYCPLYPKLDLADLIKRNTGLAKSVVSGYCLNS